MAYFNNSACLSLSSKNGGIVKYFNFPLFQSSITCFAPCFIYGTPPLPNFPYFLQTFAKKSIVEVKVSIS